MRGYPSVGRAVGHGLRGLKDSLTGDSRHDAEDTPETDGAGDQARGRPEHTALETTH